MYEIDFFDIVVLIVLSIILLGYLILLIFLDYELFLRIVFIVYVKD